MFERAEPTCNGHHSVKGQVIMFDKDLFINNTGLAFCYGPRLVENDGSQFACKLQRFSAFDQYAIRSTDTSKRTRIQVINKSENYLLPP